IPRRRAKSEERGAKSGGEINATGRRRGSEATLRGRGRVAPSLGGRRLRRLARRYMRGERPGHSLQTTALVNEAYMRLVDYKSMQWQNRAFFFAVAAQLMRRILVEHARRHNLKRGGGVP